MTVDTPFASPPRISILVSDLSKQGAGRWGGAVRTFLLAQALERLGAQVTIYGFIFGDDPAEPTVGNFPIVTVPGAYYPEFIRRSRELLRHLDTDIIYALRPKATTLGLALWHKRRTGCPIILDIDDWELSWHGGDRFRYRPSLKQLARDILKPKGGLALPRSPSISTMDGGSSVESRRSNSSYRVFARSLWGGECSERQGYRFI